MYLKRLSVVIYSSTYSNIQFNLTPSKVGLEPTYGTRCEAISRAVLFPYAYTITHSRIAITSLLFG